AFDLLDGDWAVEAVVGLGAVLGRGRLPGGGDLGCGGVLQSLPGFGGAQCASEREEDEARCECKTHAALTLSGGVKTQADCGWPFTMTFSNLRPLTSEAASLSLPGGSVTSKSLRRMLLIVVWPGLGLMVPKAA